MSTSKRKVILNTISINLGCSCRRPKLSSIFNPKPKSKTPKYQKYHNNYSYSNYSSTSSTTTTTTTTYNDYGYNSRNSTFSPYIDTTTSSSSYSNPCSSMVDGFGRAGPKSIAIEKDSNDPYVDFRQSMLQMIVENEIYTKDDLKQLLNCFLQLNSPSLHGIIIRVFTEIWNTFFFSKRAEFAPPRFYVRPKSYEI